MTPAIAQARASAHIQKYGVDAVVSRPVGTQVRGGPVVETPTTVFSLRGILFASAKPSEAVRAARPQVSTFYEFHFEGYTATTPAHLKLTAKDSLSVSPQVNLLSNNLVGTYEIVDIDDGGSGGVLMRAWLTKAD